MDLKHFLLIPHKETALALFPGGTRLTFFEASWHQHRELNASIISREDRLVLVSSFVCELMESLEVYGDSLSTAGKYFLKSSINVDLLLKYPKF